ncbi:MAG: glycosyltransferase family 39 protein [Candidatus Acidiferrales bacterium]
MTKRAPSVNVENFYDHGSIRGDARSDGVVAPQMHPGVCGEPVREEEERTLMREVFQKAATSLALILIIALGARVAFLWDQQRKIPAGVLEIVAFQQETGNIAQSLALGKGFGSLFRQNTGPTAWLAPVYPLLLGRIFRVFGIFTIRAFFAAAFLNILFSTAACVPIYYAGKRIAGLGVASGAAWLWAIFPNAIMIPFEWIWDTCLSALLAAVILWATITLAESQRLRDWCGYGLLWGFALMANPALASLLPVLLGWMIYRSWRRGTLRLERPMLAAGVIILCCLPWTIRNYMDFHRFIPLRSSLPFELWIGNNEIFDEHSTRAPARITRTEEVRRYRQLGETAYLQEKWDEATQFIRTHPGLEVRLCVNRFVALWTGLKTPMEGFHRAESLLVRVVLICNALAAIGALLGIAVLYQRRIEFAFPVAAFPIVFPCVYYITHASLRYRHAIDPVVLLLTAIAANAVFRLFAGKSGRVSSGGYNAER